MDTELNNEEDAKKFIDYHIGMCYNLSLHEFKGNDSMINYLNTHCKKIFNIISRENIIKFKEERDDYYIKIYN
jgi:hypothetical protein